MNLQAKTVPPRTYVGRKQLSNLRFYCMKLDPNGEKQFAYPYKRANRVIYTHFFAIDRSGVNDLL